MVINFNQWQSIIIAILIVYQIMKSYKFYFSMQRNHRSSSVTSDSIPVIQVIKEEREVESLALTLTHYSTVSSSTGIVTC